MSLTRRNSSDLHHRRVRCRRRPAAQNCLPVARLEHEHAVVAVDLEELVRRKALPPYVTSSSRGMTGKFFPHRRSHLCPSPAPGGTTGLIVGLRLGAVYVDRPLDVVGEACPVVGWPLICTALTNDRGASTPDLLNRILKKPSMPGGMSISTRASDTWGSASSRSCSSRRPGSAGHCGRSRSPGAAIRLLPPACSRDVSTAPARYARSRPDGRPGMLIVNFFGYPAAPDHRVAERVEGPTRVWVPISPVSMFSASMTIVSAPLRGTCAAGGPGGSPSPCRIFRR